jgi:hypothetical protein
LGDARECAETLDANHMEMCRFTSAQDPNYRKIGGELHDIYLSLEKLRQLEMPVKRKLFTRPGASRVNQLLNHLKGRVINKPASQSLATADD